MTDDEHIDDILDDKDNDDVGVTQHAKIQMMVVEVMMMVICEENKIQEIIL